jgi:hypothetical protein
MVNYEKLAEFYHKKFPKIFKEDHLMIIKGALDGERATWSKSGFVNWYNQVVEKLDKKRCFIEHIRTNPHFIMYKEGMILGGDWCEPSILEMVLEN